MSYWVTQHPLVGSDVLDITAFIASYAGLDIGKAKVDEITRFISKLSEFPKIGSTRDDILPGLRAIPAADKAVVCFTVDDENSVVFIICVSYAGSDWVPRVKARV
jgi:plasmid stabilization system protein ParE